MKAYLDWMAGSALPVWAMAGFDAERGMFRERLDLSGVPLAVPHRAMVRVRQIYVYAHAYLLGWYPEGGALAEQAMATLMRAFAEERDGRLSLAFSMDPAGGGVVSPARDSYTHAFLLFAAAWLYRLNGDARLLETADKLTAFIEGELVDPVRGGVFDALPLADRTKRQNPLMHLLEAYLALERAAPGRGYVERAGRLVALFRERLFAERNGVLLEYFAEDWSAHEDPAKAAVWEPGHHFEWVWLLAEYQALSGEDMSSYADRLYRSARTHGISPAGLIYDEVAPEGMVLKPSHRVWPHTEAMKAAAARAAAGDGEASAFGGSMAASLLGTFLDRPFSGGWIDHVDAQGRPIVDYVPASSLYHLFFAAAEGRALAPSA